MSDDAVAPARRRALAPDASLSSERGGDSWVGGLVLYLAVLLLIPVDLYRLPVTLPFDVEPQRVVLLVIGMLWVSTLLVDPRTRPVATGLAVPWSFYLGIAVLSLVANVGSLPPEEGIEPIKALVVMASWLFLSVFAASAVPDARSAERLTHWLVLLGVLLGGLAVFERVTQVNVFWQLDRVLPVLEKTGLAPVYERGGGVRVTGSSEHAIAFGALLAIVLPFAVHKMERAARLIPSLAWGAGAAVIGVGALLTGSRTALLGLAAAVAILLVLRRGLWPRMAALGIAGLLVVHMLFPGLIGGFRYALSAEHLTGHEFAADSGRGKAYPIVLADFRERPLLGLGFRRYNPQIYTWTDNEYLKQLVELGVPGVIAFAALLGVATIRPWRASRLGPADTSGFLAAVAASCGAFAVMSLGYDSLGFPQASYLFFALAGAGGALSRSALEKVGRPPLGVIRH